MEPVSSTQAPAHSAERRDGLAADAACLRDRVAALFSEHARYVCRVLARMGVADGDLDDVCQDVFLTVHRKLADFEARSSSRTWIYGICLRLAANYRRSARHRHERCSALASEHASASDASAPSALSDIDRVLMTLSGRKREVFVLYEFGELTMAEVAEVVGCPVKTCFSRLHAARRELREALTRVEDGR